MATGRIEMGPTARTVADNLRRLREARGMSLRVLSAEVSKWGRTLSADAINKIENGRTFEAGVETPKQVRRADVDDLVVLAAALNVSPLTLLLPPVANDSTMSLTEDHEVSTHTAWQWGLGRGPAMDWEPGEGVPLADPTADPAIAPEAYEREQEYAHQRTEYRRLALPPDLRRADDSPVVRLARQLEELVTDLVAPEAGVDRAGMAARARMARRRHTQLGLDIEEIIENLPPVHPGVPLDDK